MARLLLLAVILFSCKKEAPKAPEPTYCFKCKKVDNPTGNYVSIGCLTLSQFGAFNNSAILKSTCVK